MTNHHCGRENVAAVTPEGEDWPETGWFASSLQDEVKIPGLTVQQLVGMEDVTDRMNEGTADAKDDEALAKLLADNQEKILAEYNEKEPKLTHQMVSMYQGGMYKVYTYKIYDDLRLVGAPDLKIAKFGGDPDNFTYPRFSLDFTFVRAWEGDKPADTSKFYFKVKTRGPKEGETVFVTGNPGSTGRLDTIAQMKFMRDVEYPFSLRRINALLAAARRGTAEGETAEQRNHILMLENAQKAYTGYLDGLKNEKIMAIKQAAEDEIRKAVDDDEDLKAKYGDVWDKMEHLVELKTALIENAEGASRAERVSKLQALDQEEEVLAKRIGEAFFAVYGTSIPPDATFTLRLSDGVVKGYPYNGTIAPFFTSLYGLYARHTEFLGEPPFDLDQRWLDKEPDLDLTTPFCLVSTCDIIGGNSGSPMIDTDLNVVGLVFDGNIESLGNRFVFTDDVARTVCVHPAIIVEALRKIYDSANLADELEGSGPGYK